MNIISIGTDRNIWQEGSAVRMRMIEYGTLFTSLHIIVFSTKGHNLQPIQLSHNVWVYPTNSIHKLFYVFDAISIGRKIVKNLSEEMIISAQDPFETGFSAWLLSRLSHSRLHIQIHTDFLSPYFTAGNFLNAIRVKIALFILPKAYSIRVVSERIKKSIIEDSRINIKNSHISVLPIFVDIQTIKETPITVNLKKKYSQFSHIVLMATRFAKEKNVSLAIKAFAEVVKKIPTAGLIIIGSGHMLDRLKYEVKKYKLSEKIIFGSWTDSQTLVSYYKTADLFLNTSLYEGYGLTFVEAAACGTPIVSTDVGIASEVSATITSYVYSDIAQKIVNILEVPHTSQLPSMISKTDYLFAYKNSIIGLNAK